MFLKTDYRFFLAALLLILTAYICMGLDPADNGFGILTLWVAPPLLLAGFLLPIPGIIGLQNLASIVSRFILEMNKWKVAFGILVFLISFSTYIITLEPTASLWDCSEFIASSYKLQVPHTPGTPLSLLIGRIFTMFAFGDVHAVAWNLNIMSAFFSALTVLLVYHIIYLLASRIQAQGTYTTALRIIASVCGSLCLAFSDTFWFSAVEAETYGLACFFMLLILWMILKGTDLSEPIRSRWLVLIVYIAGLSYCIHPMCLLALPVLPFAWYTSKIPLTFWRVVLPIALGGFIVLFINRFIAVGIFELAFYLDLFVVNSLHLPFYTGAFILLSALIGLFIFLLRKYTMHQVYTWVVIFLLTGFLPYGMLFVRSNHNPPIDETSPENLSMIKAYMNRESYGSRPLLYGPYFDAQVEDVQPGKKIYHKGDNSYEFSGKLSEYIYTPGRQTVLPRIYSNEANHIETYRQWTGLQPGEKPGFRENILYLTRYQLNHMYLRYFLWNFAGREGDIQNSRWLTPWDGLSRQAHQQQRARNQYWMIPLILGIAGGVFQYQKKRKDFIAVNIFFLLTGIVLVLYLNSTPNEPRERDYIYVGSYIAFCIWIGLGVQAFYYILKQWRVALVMSGIITVVVPLWMLYQNYDDHNRSGRTFQIDNARNLLNSCAPNAILFTGGDNDTFPLWYVQEVEGYRTDVRIMVLSYFNTDWYISQLRKAYYESKPFQLTLTEKDYEQYGPNDVLYLQESIPHGIDVTKYLALLKAAHPALRMQTRTGDVYSVLPSKTLHLKIDKDEFLKNDHGHFLSEAEISHELSLQVTENYLQKNALAFLDLVVSNAWTRPIYFNFTSLNTFGLDLKPYVVQEGTLFRLFPIKPSKDGIAMNTTLMYKNLVEKSDYANLSNPKVYFNYEDYHLRIIMPVQQSFNMLAQALYEEGNHALAEKVLTEAVDKVYLDHLTPSITNLQASRMLLALGRKDLAQHLSHNVFQYYYAAAQQDDADPEDLYLAEKSADILNLLGEDVYLKKVNSLKAVAEYTE